MVHSSGPLSFSPTGTARDHGRKDSNLETRWAGSLVRPQHVLATGPWPCCLLSLSLDGITCEVKFVKPALPTSYRVVMRNGIINTKRNKYIHVLKWVASENNKHLLSHIVVVGQEFGGSWVALIWGLSWGCTHTNYQGCVIQRFDRTSDAAVTWLALDAGFWQKTLFIHHVDSR